MARHTSAPSAVWSSCATVRNSIPVVAAPRSLSREPNGRQDAPFARVAPIEDVNLFPRFLVVGLSLVGRRAATTGLRNDSDALSTKPELRSVSKRVADTERSAAGHTRRTAATASARQANESTSRSACRVAAPGISGSIGCGKLVIGPAVKAAPRVFLPHAAPLLEEEWHARLPALVAQATDPLRSHRPRTWPTLSAHDRPIDLIQIDLP